MGATKCCEGQLPRLVPALVQWESPGRVKRLSFKTHFFCLLMSMFLVKRFNCSGRVNTPFGWRCENYSRCYGILIRTTV